VTANQLRAAALLWQAEKRPAVLVQVVAHQGSVPRETGTRMLVGTQQVLGSIGGGHLELQAIQEARALLQQGQASPPQERHVALGPSLGQCCGGALDLRFTPLIQVDFKAWAEEPAPLTLQLYGAGHVGRAIVKLLCDLPCQVQWIDERDSEFPAGELPPHIQRVCVEPVEAEVAVAPAGASYLVLTHSHDLDLAISHAICKRADFAYFGLIGSATKRARFDARLRERGIDEAVIKRITCPIGLPGISSSKEPAAIALAVVAQLLLSVANAAAPGAL
jgi:xanthine dehydrogenase accessory factor